MGLVSKQGQEDDDGELGEIRITGFGALDDEEPDAVLIDLATWGPSARAALDERFHLLEAPHAWDGSTLVVPEPSLAWIQRVIEQVEDERTMALDEDDEQIAYDLAGWDDQHRAALEARLRDDLIPFDIADDELVVLEIDEVRVDEAIDAILEPDGPAADPFAAPGGSTGGEARTEIMGELFVAADRLVHDPDDGEGRRTIAEGAAEALTHAPPYGMDRTWWKELGDRLDAFVRLLDGGVPAEFQDNAVTQAATALRDDLRPYV
jgi:hypothetical protein